MAESMRGWAVARPGPVDGDPLAPVERPVPAPGPGQVRVKVLVCGVCRTDLHLAEGDLRPHRVGTIPGHEVVGRVDAVGEGSSRFELGQRVGIAWLRHTDETCRFCRRGMENLCLSARFTGWDDDGGYAEYAVVDEAYGYALPERFGDDEAAPLLCAGIIGYRALRQSRLPPGGRLGIYGFGASAHLATQVALFEGATVHVMTRSEQAQALALSLGAASAHGAADPPPEPLDAALMFAPVGDLVPPALEALDRGGTLAVAGIYLSDIPPLGYELNLFGERVLRSVTANTRADGEEFLRIAAEIPIKVTTTSFGLSEAPVALRALAHGRVSGAAVLHADR
ncbi:MAG TPA: zinc-dependent alcohol dehydrogenase family protein [Acidimicrobiales bacterium]|nr:zinc-dependent alcohol dehydrogenase family protein [Acidimicrobiales bacterium]